MSETSPSGKDVNWATTFASRLIYLAPFMEDPAVFMLPEDSSFMKTSTEVPCQPLEGAEAMVYKP